MQVGHTILEFIY